MATDTDELGKTPQNTGFSFYPKDLVAGGVVFLVALPLCLGIAKASSPGLPGLDVPLISGLIAGIVGGLVVGAISGSSTSVSGPAAGLIAIVVSKIEALGSFDAFLLAVVLGGIIQVGLGALKAGTLSAFFPTSVIKGLLAAIGVILILKQIPHLLGDDSDPEGDMAFQQVDQENTISEILNAFTNIHYGALFVGAASIIGLVLWARNERLKNSLFPAPVAVVIFGVVVKLIFDRVGGDLVIGESHLVNVPLAESASEFVGFLTFPDFSALANPEVYLVALTIAIVASLETLLNLEAVDKLDPQRRNSPANRELVAQGCGNIAAGMVGGLPVTSVIVRSSVNVDAGAKTKLSTLFHGFLLAVCVGFFPGYLNLIPFSALAAILMVTGFKLASPKLFSQMWREGHYQFVPFMVTLVSIIATDLLIGILCGLAVSVLYILNSNVRRPIHRVVETHLDGELTHIELANQVSFLNRAALDKIFCEAKPGSHMVIDASQTDYIDPDILCLIREFKESDGPARGVVVGLRGFRSKYQLEDEVQFVDYSTRELLDRVTPSQVLDILKEGNRRFQTGKRLKRDMSQQVAKTADGQNPLAVVLSCIDSRVPAEVVLDLGLGDVFSVRVAGNVIGTKSLGSIEYGVGVASAKVVLVLGHTRCGAVESAIELASSNQSAIEATGCDHLQPIVEEIRSSVEQVDTNRFSEKSEEEQDEIVNQVAHSNVRHTLKEIRSRSNVIRKLVDEGEIMLVGAVYDVRSGRIEFLGNQ